MDKQTLLVALLGIVLLVSLFQALQISNLSSKAGKTSITGAATANQGFNSEADMMAAHHGGGAGTSAPATGGGLSDVPNMVGGC